MKALCYICTLKLLWDDHLIKIHQENIYLATTKQIFSYCIYEAPIAKAVANELLLYPEH